MNKIKYTSLLPFRGHKGFIRNTLLKLLPRVTPNEDVIFVDLFGGSFYISYLIHKLYPNNRIICNDFDNYIDRLRNVDKTRELLKQLNKCKSREYKYHEKLDADYTQKMKEIIKSAEYVDVPTLVSRLCFSSISCDDLNDLLSILL